MKVWCQAIFFVRMQILTLPPKKRFFVKNLKKLLYAYSTTQQRKSRLVIDVIDVPKCINTKMKRVKHLLWKKFSTTVLWHDCFDSKSQEKHLSKLSQNSVFLKKTCIQLGNSFIHILWKYKGLMLGDIFCQNTKTNPTPQKAFFVKK